MASNIDINSVKQYLPLLNYMAIYYQVAKEYGFNPAKDVRNGSLDERFHHVALRHTVGVIAQERFDALDMQVNPDRYKPFTALRPKPNERAHQVTSMGQAVANERFSADRPVNPHNEDNKEEGKKG